MAGAGRPCSLRREVVPRLGSVQRFVHGAPDLEMRQRSARNGGRTTCGVHPDHPKYSKYQSLYKRYKMTFEQYHNMLDLQDGCDICNAKGRRMVVDHDHSCCGPSSQNNTCGKCVRALLCDGCNTAIGQIERVGLGKIMEWTQKWA